MTAQKSEDYNKFWFGFAVGTALCAAAAAAVGTKQGRKLLKKTVDYMESVEGTPDQIHNLTDTIQTLASVFAEIKSVEIPEEKPTITQKKAPEADDDESIGTLIDRMRTITTGQKQSGKFFKKPKK